MQIKSTICAVEALPLILVIHLGLVELEAEREMQEWLLLITFFRLVVLLSAHMSVFVKAPGPKSSKEVHKTKAIKAGSGSVQFDASHETFCVQNTTADAQYQIRVVNHGVIGQSL
jgi:hypothetical protein